MQRPARLDGGSDKSVGIPAKAHTIVEKKPKAIVGKVRLCDVFRDIGNLKACQGSIQNLEHAIEDKLAVDTDSDLLPLVLELPRIEAAINGKAQVDAAMGGQFMRCPGSERFAK